MLAGRPQNLIALGLRIGIEPANQKAWTSTRAERRKRDKSIDASKPHVFDVLVDSVRSPTQFACTNLRLRCIVAEMREESGTSVCFVTGPRDRQVKDCAKEALNKGNRYQVVVRGASQKHPVMRDEV
jgi:hypothetical protein